MVAAKVEKLNEAQEFGQVDAPFGIQVVAVVVSAIHLTACARHIAVLGDLTHWCAMQSSQVEELDNTQQFGEVDAVTPHSD